MKQSSNSNVDSLFRKAGSDYPLKTDTNNWNVVAAKLSELKQTTRQRRNRRWLLAAFLLLLIIGSSAIYFNKKNSGNSKQIAATSTKINSVKKDKPLQNVTGSVLKSNGIINNNASNQSEKFSVQNDQEYTSKSNEQFRKKVLKQTNVVSNETIDTEKFRHSLHDFENLDLAEISSNQQNQPGIISKELAGSAQNLLLTRNIKESNSNQQKKSIHIKILSRPGKFLYGSLFVSPDFSTVKYQRINKPGYRIGVQLGYRINNNLSAELGLVRYHTELYSSGKYFNRNLSKLKPNMQLNDVSGNSKITEVPFDIRYNFSKTNNHFFITAGTSFASITHKQRYKYDIIKNGVPVNLSRHFSAVTGTKYLSNISMSAGYEAPVISSFNLKIEPYYQIPVKKFGVGDLQVTHFGISLGIVKNLK